MQELLIVIPVLILSVVLHEVAHGWVARWQGDPTAAMLGRLTLNPIPHLDPMGSFIVPAALALFHMPILGWARPVPVNPRNFRNFKRGDILVSLAGVTVNLLLAIAFTLLGAAVVWAARLAPEYLTTWQIVATMAQYGIYINFILLLFNLIPIPPLDGSHVFYYLLPVKWAVQYRRIGMRGTLILLALLWVGGFTILEWPLRVLVRAAMGLQGLLT